MVMALPMLLHASSDEKVLQAFQDIRQSRQSDRSALERRSVPANEPAPRNALSIHSITSTLNVETLF